ncbi:hypothetical protein EST38_g716 [Candolleomyces aberdarensis]|uniref:rRNA adenine N(6)-methyltransferase n=1 Tax=Candolleomyces aberdarensis TaxID=2316362 RepID=A0A4Q2E007_9AGAR|nr:hypothetical protein EST38_g716 [Candolleomyces aberdarensis]
MPKATSEKLSRAHKPAPKKKDSQASGSANTNPLFNTARFGQHILKNAQTAQKIVDAANLKPTDKVLEVGPGTGNLTVKILEKAKHVTAVEMDPRMAAEVLKRVQGTPEQRKLEVVIGDFVKVDIPYFELYAKVDNIINVNRNDFRPPPQVESSVIRLVPIDPPPPVKFEEFDGLNRIIFSRPNKTIRGNFQAKGVMKMLDQNRRTWLSMQEMAVDDENESINDILDKILNEGSWTESRAAKMDIDEILK